MRIGSKHTEETKLKMSISHKGQTPWNKNKALSEAHRKKISYALKGNTYGFKEGNIPWNKGVPMSEETKLKVSLAKKGQVPWNKGTKGVCKPNSGSFKKGHKPKNPPWNKGKTGVRCGIPKGRKNPGHSEFMKKYMEEHHPFRGKTYEEFYGKEKANQIKKKISIKGKGRKAWNKGIPLSKETRKRLRSIGLEKWKDSKYRENQIELIVKGLMKRPTSLERQMIKIIKKHNLPFKYVGDGSFLIGFRNPDFVNIDGEKICIEVANIYHHPENYPKKRIKHFKKWGWKCIVFRTDTLDEKSVLSTIQEIR